MTTLTGTAGPAMRRARGSVHPRRDGLTGVSLALWIACAFFVFLPLGAILVLAVGGSQFGMLLDGDVVEAATNSLVSAVASALLAVLIGAGFAILFDRTDLPGRRPLRLLALTPLLMPPFVGAIAWLGVAGPTSPVNLWWRETFGAPLWSIYGADGVIFLLTVHSYPLAMIIVAAALRRVPSDLEQAARIAGASPARALFAVTLPLLRPALLSSFLLIAVGNLADFGIPSIIGLPERFVTLATLVYRYLQSGTVDDPLAVVAAIGVVLLVLAIGALLLNMLIGRRGGELDASSAPPQVLVLGRARAVTGIVVWALVLIITVLPLLALLVQALLRAPGVPLVSENLTLDHLVRALTTQTALDGAKNSVMLAVLAAVICGVLGLGIGVLSTRTSLRGSRALGGAAMLPQAIPGIVIAVAWLIIAPRIGLFNTPWLILAAYVTSFTALVVQAVNAPLASTPSSAEEAARVSGAGRVRALFDISCRMALPAALSGAVIVAVTAVRELTLSVLLLSPGSQTLGVAIFSFQQAGAFSTAAAWSLIVAIVGIAVIGFATRRPADT
ncbi:iron(III) transport system permease protein [Microbacterium keratanolyticum]|uniref:Iron ABC transporter permease n=1 Tax=Microbacterium keratanolyticum TaxID=67574 RepID=A0A9W6HQT9_9MICO|nr:iron ABC transporter permease [Microbacterium keratanolyticum]MBM7468422.1 iron(III) transport system permease protein [Microbacterium keratanolyticum]GLK00496.1 iron ABC transporter permease [Microbacterium keratanolyticum]